MDFIEQLPKLDTILVVVNRLTKYGHFFNLKHPFSAKEVAILFLDNVHKLHGMPKVIVSYCDKIFTSLLWKEIMRLSGAELHSSSAYHLETDEQTKRSTDTWECTSVA